MSAAATAVTYIYGLVDPRTDRLRYVGKANDIGRRVKGHIRDCRRRNSAVHVWLRELADCGVAPDVDCIALVPADLWEVAEQQVIASARRSWPDLLNRHRGGNEPKQSAAQRAETGRTLYARRNRRIWAAKRMIGEGIRRGEITDRVRAKLRLAAQRAPHLFGEYALL